MGLRYVVCSERAGYDCGMYLICIAEHLCRQMCEYHNEALADVITEASVSLKRQQLLKLISELSGYNVPIGS